MQHLTIGFHVSLLSGTKPNHSRGFCLDQQFVWYPLSTESTPVWAVCWFRLFQAIFSVVSVPHFPLLPPPRRHKRSFAASSTVHNQSRVLIANRHHGINFPPCRCIPAKLARPLQSGGELTSEEAHFFFSANKTPSHNWAMEQLCSLRWNSDSCKGLLKKTVIFFLPELCQKSHGDLLYSFLNIVKWNDSSRSRTENKVI